MEKRSLIKVLKQFGTINIKIRSLEKLNEKDLLNNYCYSEIHCIDLIAKMDDANVTNIAEKLGMTRGAISKITKKLIDKGAIISYQIDNNRKKVFYELTELGQVINDLHMQWHVDWEERSTIFFSHWKKDDLMMVYDFLETYKAYLDYRIDKLNHRR